MPFMLLAIFPLLVTATSDYAKTPRVFSSEKVLKAGSGETDVFSFYVTEIKIDGVQPVYDKFTHGYLLPVKTAFRGGKAFVAIVDAVFSSRRLALKIDGKEVMPGDDFNFGNVAGGKSVKLTVTYDGYEITSTMVTFTFLPIVEITGENFQKTYYTPGKIRVTDPETQVAELLSAEFRHRGANAALMTKKSYAVKLKDSKGKKLNRSFFGMRSDNNWILDAMAVDRARMRNRVSTDLWLAFSTKPYHAAYTPKMINGTRGRFVEVILNGEYAGIYCFTEKIDEKQLDLPKSQGDGRKPEDIRSLLYKSAQWSYSTLMGHYVRDRRFPKTTVLAADPKSNVWDGWELKYPDLSKGHALDWEPLRSAINIVALGNQKNFMDNVEEYFDLPVWRDYYLFLELMLATDNQGKNMYLYLYDKTQSKKLSLTPWDLDGTWGMLWDGTETVTADATQDYVTYLWQRGVGESCLYYYLSLYNFKQWNQELAARYAQLRTEFFNPDSLVKRFRDYHNLFKESGADARETSRWHNTDNIPLSFDVEMNYVENWIRKRIQMLDGKYCITSSDGVIFSKDGKVLVSYPADKTGDYQIPEGTESVNAGAFANAAGLTSVSIPRTLSHIGEGAFSRCEKLEAISVNRNNAYYSSVDGTLYSKDKTDLVALPNKKAGARYTLLPGVKNVNAYALCGLSNIEHIIFPESVTGIAPRAIADCGRLKSIGFMGENYVPELSPAIVYGSDPAKIVVYVRKNWYENAAHTTVIAGYDTVFDHVHPSFVSMEGYDHDIEFFPLSKEDVGVIDFKGTHTSTIIDKTVTEPARTGIGGKHWASTVYQVKTIMDNAFKDKSTIKEIVVLADVEYIGAEAFKAGRQLEKIYFVSDTPAKLNMTDFPFYDFQVIFVKVSKVGTYRWEWQNGHSLRIVYQIPQTTNRHGATVCYPFDVVFPSGQGKNDVKPYLLVDYSHANDDTYSYIRAKSVDDYRIPAFVGMFIWSKNAESVSTYCRIAENQTHSTATLDMLGYDKASHMLVGTVEEGTIVHESGYQYFAFSKSKGKLLPLQEGVVFPRFKSYLRIPKTAAAKLLNIRIDDEDNVSETTDIHALGAEDGREQPQGAIYNLNGVRVVNPQKGVFIQEGKKVIFR